MDRLKILRRIGNSSDSWFVVGLLLISLSANLYLIRERHRSPSSPATLPLGVTVPALPVQDLEGKKVTIDWSSDGRPTLLYVFSPNCVWCKRNLENLRVIDRARKSQYRFVGVSLSKSDLTKYVEDVRLDFPVYVVVDKVAIQRFRLSATPETLIISRDGKTEQVWLGAYGGSLQKSVESTFGLKLPGLPTAGSTLSPTS